MLEFISDQIERSIQTKRRLIESELEHIATAGEIVSSVYRSGNKLLLCGNGGSASDAQHIAAELLVRFKSSNTRRSLPALSLAADSSTVTAGGNDLGFDAIFSRQVEGLGREGDALMGFSTSGNSKNVLEAFLVARGLGMKNILLTGSTGGSIVRDHSDLLDVVIRVPAEETARIQEAHIMIGHILCSIVEKNLFQME